MAETSIEWTDATWNPVAGCTILTAGCTNCYAMRMAARLEAMGVPKYAGLTRKSGERYLWTGAISLDEATLDAPKAWRKPRLIFVNSMSDLFQEAVPVEFIRRVWDTMAKTPQHTYQVLTKRPDRMARITPDLPLLPNVWLGTSVENAAVLDRLDHLRATPAAVRFVSFEPLIGSVAGSVQLRAATYRESTGPSSAGKAGLAPDRCSRNGSTKYMRWPRTLASRSSSSNGAAGTRRRPGGPTAVGIGTRSRR